MDFYSINASQNATPVDDVRNGIWLRNDIHQAFDAKLFTLTVKNQKPVVHFMAPTYGLGGMYHNCELRLSYDAVAAFFFARFAWSIFPMAQRFVERPGVRTTDKSYEQSPTFRGIEAPHPVDAAAADETLEYGGSAALFPCLLLHIANVSPTLKKVMPWSSCCNFLPNIS
jgi:hypothetical protein